MEEKEYIEKKVEELISELLELSGLILVDVEFKGIGGRKILQIAIDRENGGVTLDDCERVSRELSLLLDTEDFVPGPYILEVTSPGLDRILKKDREIKWARGKKVIVYTLEGEIKGKLRDIDDKFLVLEDGKKIEREKIQKIKLNEV